MKKCVIFSSLLFVIGCSLPNSDDSDHDFEIIGEEKAEIIGEFNESIMDSIDRDQYEEYEEIIDSMADREHHFPTNRYKVSPQGTGVLYMYDEKGDLMYRGVMGYTTESVMVDIKEEYSVNVTGFEAIAFESVKTKPSNQLYAGIWEVGEDIEAGEYTLSGEGHGYVKIFDPTEDPRVFEVIGNPYADSTDDVQLVDGQKLEISGLEEVNFE